MADYGHGYTRYFGLRANGPMGWAGQPGEDGSADFDSNMHRMDAICYALQQAITALGGSIGSEILLDSGEF